MENNYQVLLYYKYVDIEDPQAVMEEQKALCEELVLKGRIIVATEGINGTLEGTVENTEKYISEMNKIPAFNDINYKKSPGNGNAFPKLSVKVRPEIVSAYMPELNPNKITGKYISADELHKWFEEKREFYIVDMRNDYEYNAGYFEGSMFSGFSNFRDLKSATKNLAHLKDKTVVTVCTGGVRCEKASGFLVQEGFADVYQLKDGIQTYMEKYPNKHFKGKLYVFDGRITIGFNTNSPEHEIVGRCLLCNKPSDSYVNCANEKCHKHFICCEDCRDEVSGLSFCSDNCYHVFYSSKHEAKSSQLFPMDRTA